MSTEARFWRNVGLVAVAHLGAVIALWHVNGRVASPGRPAVMWMNVAAGPTASAVARAAPNPPPAETAPPETPSNVTEEPVEPAPPEKSEIQLPAATPRPTPIIPRPAVVAKPSVPSTPKARTSSAKPGVKKALAAKVTPKPVARPKPTAAEEKPTASPAVDGGPESSKSSGGGTGNRAGASSGSETSWYSSMLHDRFHSAWEQPTSVVGTKARMSVLVKLRIEKDGRVSDFKIVKPSGNVVVDESVTAVAKKVTRVDPLPTGVGSGGSYEVKINFELNADQ